MPRTAWSKFDVVEFWGFTLATRSFWSWLLSFLCCIFDSYESWMEFPCEWWLLTFQGFDFWRRQSSSVFRVHVNELSDSELPCKPDICLAYLWITATGQSSAVPILISPCFRDNINEIAQELNIICHSKKGANAKRTLSSSLEKTAAWQFKGQKKLQSSPSQSLSSMTQVSETQF